MFKQLLSVFLESGCSFCDRSTANILCEYCFQKLSSHQLSQSDRRKLISRGCGDFSTKSNQGVNQKQFIFAWGKYDGQLKRAIAQMKYNNQPEIGEVLGKLLGEVWLESNLSKLQHQITVISIPLHSRKLKERGFNQAEVIAKSFCQTTRYRLNTQALIRVKETKAMFDLKSTEARADNLRGAFCIGDKLPKNPVLLVDDIYTTGTTIKESARVLQQNKIKVIGVAVVALAGIAIRA